MITLDLTAPLLEMAERAQPHAVMRPGQVLHGKITVEGGQKSLHILETGGQIASSSLSGLPVGQAVRVEVMAAQSGLQLRLSVPNPPVQTSQSEPFQNLADLAMRIAATLRVPLDADDLLSFLPQSVPPSQAQSVLPGLLSLFASRGSVPQDLGLLAGMVAEAIAQGTLSARDGQILTDLLTILEHGPADLERALPDIVRNSAGTEARLAALLETSPEAVARLAISDLPTQLARLLDNVGFAASLRERGQFEAFQNVAGRLFERFDAVQVQNLHGLQHAYVFAELPMPSGGPLRHVAIHLLTDKRRDRGQSGPAAATIALDVSTERLGDLWVTFRATGGASRCLFRAANPETAARIRGAASELSDALGNAGFRNAVVDVEGWDGNRLRETAAFLRPLSGLDLTA